jgi:photosystem II stability/assembly factor-like uncharacterized protein
MNQVVRAVSIVCVCLLFLTSVRYGGAQDTPPPAPSDNIPGELSLPNIERDGLGVKGEDGEEKFERMEANRSLMGGELGDDFKQHAIEELQRQQQLYGQQLAGGNAPQGVPSWRSVGPTQAKYQTNGVTLKVSDSGRIRTILPHPTDPDTMYLLTSGGGLWKTTTFTHTNPQWESKTDALISTSGGAAAFGRTPETLYLGIGDPFDVRGLIAGVMVKSTNGGNTWGTLVPLAGATNVRDVKVDTSGPSDVVLVAANNGLFRSTDGGVTYTKSASPAFAGKTVWSLVRTSAGWLASATSGSGFIYFSTDKGATWILIPNAGNAYGGAGRTTLAVANPGEAVVYAFAANPAGNNQRDLFKSTDGGLNWTALGINAKTPARANDWQPNMNLMAGQAFYNQLILVDPRDSSRNTVYLGGQLATARTTDGGANWTLVSDWLPNYLPDDTLPYVHADCHAAVLWTAGGQNTLIFGTDGGIFVSRDGGASWSDDKNDGIVAFLSNSISGSSKNPQDVIIGLQDTGTRARLGSSSVFNQVVGGDGEGVGWSQANNAFTLASFPGISFARSQGLLPNTFGDWFRANDGIAGLDYYYFFTNIATPRASADPTGGQFFTYTGLRIYKTNNGAATWNVFAQAGSNGLSSSFTPPGAALFRQTHHGIGISPLDTNHISIAENGGRLAITADGGASWVERNLITLVPGYAGFNTSSAWADNNKIYLASENPNANSIRLVKSTNGGATWAAANAGLPDVPINRILVDPNDATGNTVYAATWIGVYRTTNGGASWSLFGAGLPRVEVSDLYIPSDGRVLRISTYGRGVWEINL